MLRQMPTMEMVKKWKQVYEEKKDSLRPNRKTGTELDQYLKTHYSVTRIHTDKADQVVIDNIMNNEIFKEKLAYGELPKPVTYEVGENHVFVGIDLVTGYFCVEDSEKIYDELYAYRGLDEKDLKNYYMVAEYIACLEKKKQVDEQT